jgi:hypothetical protein
MEEDREFEIDEICKRIGQLWKKSSGMRFGEFLLAYVFLEGKQADGRPDYTARKMFNIGDSDLNDVLQDNVDNGPSPYIKLKILKDMIVTKKGTVE